MTNRTLTDRIDETRNLVHQIWLDARQQFPYQPAHEITAYMAAALAQMDRAVTAAENHDREPTS